MDFFALTLEERQALVNGKPLADDDDASFNSSDTVNNEGPKPHEVLHLARESW